MAEGQFRLRVRYVKQGRLAYLSHLELIRAQERMIRRAGLPYAITQGFSPHMKIAFGPALGVGVASDDEYLDVWLTTYVEPAKAAVLLHASEVSDLHVREVFYLSDKEPSLTAALTVAHYEIVLHDSCDIAEGADMHVIDALSALVTAGTLEIEKKGKKKTLDLCKLLYCEPTCKDAIEDDASKERLKGTMRTVVIDLMTRSSNEGALRPDVFAHELERRCGQSLAPLRITRLAQYEETKYGLKRPNGTTL